MKNRTKTKILIIDDELWQHQALVDMLRADGYNIILANGGAEGLELAEKHEPDLILLDIYMPDISGDIVLEEIKKRKIKTRVIIVTGVFDTFPDVIRFVKAGACDYLIKPYTRDEIVNSIKRALSLENTINIVSSSFNPIMEKMISDYQEAIQEIEKLKKQNRQSKFVSKLYSPFIRLLYLLFVFVITIIFYKIGIFTSSQTVILFPIILFVLMLLPIENIIKFTAKHLGSEASVEMKSKK